MSERTNNVAMSEEQVVRTNDARIPYTETKTYKWGNIIFRKTDGPPGNQTPVYELGDVTVRLVKTVYGSAVTCKAQFYCWTNSLGQYSTSDPTMIVDMLTKDGQKLHTLNFGGIHIGCEGKEYNIERDFPQQWFESVGTASIPPISSEGDGC